LCWNLRLVIELVWYLEGGFLKHDIMACVETWD
jgi:hypothetical protein